MMLSNERSMLGLLGCCAFTSMASMRICDSMLPLLAQEFSVTAGDASIAISAFALAYGVSQLVYGPLGDRYGKTRIIALATLACSFGNAWSGIATSFEWLVAGRVTAGVAAAGIIPLTMAWIGDGVPYEERQVVLAKLLGATVFGMISGQWVGGVLAESLGWRSAFFSLALIFCCAGVLLFRANGHVPGQQQSRSYRLFHVYGAVVQHPWARVILLVTAVEGALAFSTLAFLPSYLHQRFSLSTSLAGALVAFYGIGGLIFSRAAGQMLRRRKEAGLARIGGFCAGCAFLALALAPSWYIAPFACLLAGFGFYALHSTLQTNATQMAPENRGTAVSMFVCCLFLGQSVGIWGASKLMDHSASAIVFGISGFGFLVLGFSFAMAIEKRGHHAS